MRLKEFAPGPNFGGSDDRPENIPLEEIAKMIIGIIGDQFTVERTKDAKGKYNKLQPGFKFVPKDKTKFGFAKIWCLADRRVGEYPTYHMMLGKYYMIRDYKGEMQLTGHLEMAEKYRPKNSQNAFRTAELILGNRKGALQQGVTETLDKDGYHISVQKGKFLPSQFGEDEYNYLHDLMNSSEASGKPMLVTVNDKRLAREIAAMYGGDVEKTGLGTYRIVQRRGAAPVGSKTPELSTINEFVPGNGDDGLPHAEYLVYQCDPHDQFEFIGGPLYQTDSLPMAHKYAYGAYVKHRPLAFVIYQPSIESSRGNYGVKGESDGSNLNEFAPGGDFKPPAPPKQKGNDPWGNDDRSKILQAVKQLLAAGNKVDWKVPGQMGHVVRVNDDGVTMKRWGKPYSKIHYFLPLTDDRDDQYQILMVKPGYYKVVSSDPDRQL